MRQFLFVFLEKGDFIKLKKLFINLISLFVIISLIVFGFMYTIIFRYILYNEISDKMLINKILNKADLIIIISSIIIILLLVLLIHIIISKIFIKINNTLKIPYNKYDLFNFKTNIYEFDFIIDKINNIIKYYDDDIYNLDMVSDYIGKMFGIFKIDLNKKVVIISNKLAQFFECADISSTDNFTIISIEEFKKIKDNIIKNKVTNEAHTYYFNTQKERKWINVYYNDFYKNISFGLVIDVTKQMTDKYKNNFNDLTIINGHLNFIDKIKIIISENNIKCGCFIILELDNLRYINDIYGYYTGNEYLHKTVDIIKNINKNLIVGKKSDNEFLIFVYSCEENVSSENLKDEFNEKLSNSSFVAPNKKILKYRFTGGCSYYLEDCENPEKLYLYATFALYEANTMYKGSLHTFSLEAYNHDKFIKAKIDAFNNLVENNDIEYYFQPIVNLKDGSIYGYEALMRNSNFVFSSAKEIIEIAASENKLYIIEKLTILNCLNIVNDNQELFRKKRLFYNTISGQILNHEDAEKFKRVYSEIGHMLVCEIITASDKSKESIIKKCSILKQRESKVAVNCYDLNIEGLNMFIKDKPDFLKIDYSFVSDIDVKKEMQSMVTKFVKYAKDNNILTIAVGIEKSDELEFLIKLGVDFAQGYYFSSPKPDFIEEIKPNIKNEIRKYNS